MLEITSTIFIDENEIQLDFVRSAGPGGQNVNKVSTAVKLRFDVANSPSLSDDIKARLTLLAGSRMTDSGILLIEAHQYRTQEQNRADAILRLIQFIRKATEKPKPRKKTRPSAASQEKRILAKKTRGAIKRTRRSPSHDIEA